MRKNAWLVASVCVASAALAHAAAPAGTPGFDKLKTLVGVWDGQTPDKGSVQVSYKLVSGDSALVETITPAGEPEMMSVYAADGDRVAMTHYCSAHNQPRMESAPIKSDPQEIDLQFAGGTNIPTPDTPHMHHLVITFVDTDHITQKWTWREGGTDKVMTFQLARRKSS